MGVAKLKWVWQPLAMFPGLPYIVYSAPTHVVPKIASYNNFTIEIGRNLLQGGIGSLNSATSH